MTDYIDVGGSTRIDASPPDSPPPLPDDAYPAIIEDQRHAYGCAAVADVARWQAAWLAGESPPHAVPRPPIGDAIRDDRTVVPFINASRWIAECPQCRAANAVWDANPLMVCLACARVYEVAWQLPTDRAEVIRVLADWPTPNRSWDAHKGETVEELKIQAVLMQGVAPDLRNGLIVAAGVTMPDELTSPGEYLDRLIATRIKGEEEG